MSEEKIQFPGFMERSQGFSIPENKCFYVVSFDDLIYYDLNNSKITEIDDWGFDERRNVILFDGKEIPFIGLWGGNPILNKSGVGKLSLDVSTVTLTCEDGTETKWSFENFSGDWAQVTFDTKIKAFLYGTPYDFDYRFVSIL